MSAFKPILEIYFKFYALKKNNNKIALKMASIEGASLYV